MSTLMEQTSEKETKQVYNNHNDEELEIDLMDLLRKVIGIRKKIYKAAGIGLIIGVIVAISIPKQYTVEVTLSPEMGNNKGGGLSGLAAFDQVITTADLLDEKYLLVQRGKKNYYLIIAK